MYVCFYESACFFWFLGVHECVRVCYIVSVSSFLMFKEFCVLWTTFGGMCDFMFRCVCVCEEHCFRICSTFGLWFSSPRITQGNSSELFFTGCAGRSWDFSILLPYGFQSMALHAMPSIGRRRIWPIQFHFWLRI